MNKSILLGRIGLLAAMFAMFLTSCENHVIFDEEGDCSVSYRIKFKYDRNMKFADAFSKEVSSVALYVFGEDGLLVHQATESGALLADENYTMPLELQPGKYDMLAWCGIADGSCYDVPEAVIGVTTKEELTCRINRVGKSGYGVVDKDLAPLFHGELNVELPGEPGVHVRTISLTKNTNAVRIVLQQLSGEDVDPDMFSFEIQDYNGYMAHDNTLLQDELLIYKPWSLQAGSADIDADIYHAPETRATSVGVAVAELTVGRLVDGERPILVIRNVEKNKVVLSIPLIDYALLVKGYYNRAMSDQEYLDRQDEYNMTFFLDESGQWASASIIVNSWRVVLNNQVIK